MTHPMDLSEQGTTLVAVHTWRALLAVGVITTAIGVVVLAWPGETLTVVSILVGAQIVVYSLFRLAQAFTSNTVAPPLLVGVAGVMGLVVGIAVLRHPFEAAAVLAVLLGIVWVVGGVVDLLAAVSDRTLSHRGLRTLSAMVATLAGVVVLAWPAPTITVLAWIVGLQLAVFGIILCLLALLQRS